MGITGFFVGQATSSPARYPVSKHAVSKHALDIGEDDSETEAGGVIAVSVRLELRPVGIGSLLAVLGAFPVAAVVALVFRFPIPFTGYCSGLEAVLPSLVAVLFYGCIGGFPFLAVLGAVGGLAAFVIGRPDEKKTFRLTLGFALVVDLLATLTLAVLDKIIGPW